MQMSQIILQTGCYSTETQKKKKSGIFQKTKGVLVEKAGNCPF